MESASFADLLINPTVLVAVFIGGSALLLVYILKLFRIENDAQERNQSEQAPSGPERKKETKQPKKKNWNRPSEKHQNFSSPWLLKTLKSHTGQVLNMDYSSNGKYLASCAEEEPDPDMNSSSGSECNKENTRPPSAASPSPKGGLTRRQRKNRRREDSSPDAKKKAKSEAKQIVRIIPRHLRIDVSEGFFVQLLYSHLLTPVQMESLGYPVVDFNVVFVNIYNAYARAPKFDVNAREFVPRRQISNSNSEQSSDSSETEDSSGSEPERHVYRPFPVSSTGLPELYRPYCPPLSDLGIERTCVRCGRGFFTTPTEYLTHETCVYHWGKLYVVDRTTGLSRYTCCNGGAESVGCATCKLHVWNGVVSGRNGPYADYVRTVPPKSFGCHGVYAVDCEMCYTVAGLELTKVTVVGMDGKMVYDSYVRPHNEIVDYNTRFSGITPKDLRRGATKTLEQVQNDLGAFVSAKTVLIGHGLENDLRALKMVHHCVVDTAMSFPHYHGPPYKRSLKSLVATYLRRQVQCGPGGHDSYEDAVACMELMLFKIKQEYSRYLS